jgi:hypothetical protein
MRRNPVATAHRHHANIQANFHQVEADQDWEEVRLDAITRQLKSIQQK